MPYIEQKHIHPIPLHPQQLKIYKTPHLPPLGPFPPSYVH